MVRESFRSKWLLSLSRCCSAVESHNASFDSDDENESNPTRRVLDETKGSNSIVVRVCHKYMTLSIENHASGFV